QVAGRVAYAARAKVDHGRELTLREEQVPLSKIAVEPDVDAVPLRLERLGPHPTRRCVVNVPAQVFHRLEGLSLVGPEGRSAEPVVLAGLRPFRGVDGLQGGDEVREVLSETDRVRHLLER